MAEGAKSKRLFIDVPARPLAGGLYMALHGQHFHVELSSSARVIRSVTRVFSSPQTWINGTDTTSRTLHQPSSKQTAESRETWRW